MNHCRASDIDRAPFLARKIGLWISQALFMRRLSRAFLKRAGHLGASLAKIGL